MLDWGWRGCKLTETCDTDLTFDGCRSCADQQEKSRRVYSLVSARDRFKRVYIYALSEDVYD